jgi:D-glycero-D-manno-heptose 1,7-bisphosphate phosphatase
VSAAQPPREIRHVILDRDGVLNVEAPHGGYVRDPSGFQWLPGALEGLALLAAARVRLSVVTNQAGVGRGLMTLNDLALIHERMRSEAAAHAAPISEVLFCPHAPEEGCDCRKPAPRLIVTAIQHAGIPATQSVVVGDDERDFEAARRAEVAFALVRTGKGRRAEARIAGAGAPAYDDLLVLARALLER